MEISWNLFQNFVVDKFNKYCPKKKIKTKMKSLNPWITIEKKNNAEKNKNYIINI